MLRLNNAAVCYFVGFTAGTLLISASFASVEPVSNQINTAKLNLEDGYALTETMVKPVDKRRQPKLKLSTHMASITLPKDSALPEETDTFQELQLAAREQPKQTLADYNQPESTAIPPTIEDTGTKQKVAALKESYQEENNYLLALALILLTASGIACVLFLKVFSKR